MRKRICFQIYQHRWRRKRDLQPGLDNSDMLPVWRFTRLPACAFGQEPQRRK